MLEKEVVSSRKLPKEHDGAICFAQSQSNNLFLVDSQSLLDALILKRTTMSRSLGIRRVQVFVGLIGP